MSVRVYFQQIQEIIDRYEEVSSAHLSFDEIDQIECYIRGMLQLLNGFTLHVAEYVITEPAFLRDKYRYHLQDPDNHLITRWDNAPHHPEVSSFPDHQHNQDGTVQASTSMDIPKALDASISIIAAL